MSFVFIKDALPDTPILTPVGQNSSYDKSCRGIQIKDHGLEYHLHEFLAKWYLHMEEENKQTNDLCH